MLMRPRRAATTLIAGCLLVAASLVAAGCAGSDDADDDPTPPAATSGQDTSSGGGGEVDRAEPIEVTSPEPFDEVVRTMRFEGRASVPEATVQWRLVRGEDEVMAEGFVTADCAAPCRGDFREDVPLIDTVEPGNYTLLVWGQRQGDIDEGDPTAGRIGFLEIPITLYAEQPGELPEGEFEQVDPTLRPPEAPDVGDR